MKLEKQIATLLEEKIENHSQYVKWVRKWKKIHADTVSRIVFFKSEIKNTGQSVSAGHRMILNAAVDFPDLGENYAKLEQQGELNMFAAQLAQASLQQYLHLHAKMVRPMYLQRLDRKTFLKEGKYPFEESMKGHNSRNHDSSL